MTIEELKNKKITIDLHKEIIMGEDLDDCEFENMINKQETYNFTDAELLSWIIQYYYGSYSDIEDIVPSDEYKITIE